MDRESERLIFIWARDELVFASKTEILNKLEPRQSLARFFSYYREQAQSSKSLANFGVRCNCSVEI